MRRPLQVAPIVVALMLTAAFAGAAGRSASGTRASPHHVRLRAAPADSSARGDSMPGLDREALRRLPLRGVIEAVDQIAIAPNAWRSFVLAPAPGPLPNLRGGAVENTAYQVDGFSCVDAFTGLPHLELPQEAIASITFDPGFSARYGRATAGVVRIDTREPASVGLRMDAEAVTDAPATWAGSERIGLETYEAALGGPLIEGSDWLKLFAAGRRHWAGDRAPGFVADNLTRDAGALGAATFDHGRQPGNGRDGWSLLGTLTIAGAEQSTLKLGGLVTRDDWREGDAAWLYDLAHTPRVRDQFTSLHATMRVPHADGGVEEIAVRRSETSTRRGDGVHFDDFPAYANPDGNPGLDLTRPFFWLPGHASPVFERFQASSWELRATSSRRVGAGHRVEAGTELRLHTLRFYHGDIGYASYDTAGALESVLHEGYGYDGFGAQAVDGGDDGPRHPREWASWVEERFDRGGWTAEGGLRYDRLESRTPTLVYPADFGSEVTASGPPATSSTFSPRASLTAPAGPVKLRARFGRFVQFPPLSDVNPSLQWASFLWQARQHQVPTGAIRPGRATAWELGAAAEPVPGHHVDLALWLRDATDPVFVTSVDRVRARGLELRWSGAFRAGLSAQVAYALSRAEGEGPLPDAGSIAWGASTPRVTAPLDWDQRHRLLLDLALGFVPKPGGHPGPGVALRLAVASGLPYTATSVYDEVTLAVAAAQATSGLNARRGPASMSLDLRATEPLRIGKGDLELSLWIVNLLNRRNAMAVYSGTGSATTTGWLASPAGQGWLSGAGAQAAALYGLAESRPSFYGPPCIIRLGAVARF
ncbi:MAG TPA: hypothetical protein VMS88_06835 [Terriglobales bacterium]|nr:hypothetical protein [Terriglobales bacterium]